MSLSEREKKEAEQFKHTILYMGMAADIRFAKQDMAYYKQQYEDTKEEISRLKSDIKRHLDDGTAKITPITDTSKLERDYDMALDKIKFLEKENARLRDRLNEVLYELHPEDMPKKISKKTQTKSVGRPTIGSPAEYAEAREMKKKGYSVAEIADYMGWSVGFTQGKVKNTKADPELRKKHLAEKRKHKKND